MVASESFVKKYGLKPIARFISSAVEGVDPSLMVLGPIQAVRKALARAGIISEQIDLIELNEAFASQSIVCINEFGLDAEKINVNGGAIALGHPLGSSGSRIILTLLHEMEKRKLRTRDW